MNKQLIMSIKEADRIPTIQQLVKGNITARQAAQELSLSMRHIRRLKIRFAQQGTKGLIHGNRGRKSNRRIPIKKIQSVIALLKRKYYDFGPTLAYEKLTECHQITFSRETLRKEMIKAGLWKAKKKKILKVYQQRTRRGREGELVQVDGSPHAWFEDRGPKSNLLVYIDDATGKLKQLLFTPSETTESYFQATKEYIKKHGKPVAFYVDKHSVFKTSNNRINPEKPTQFARAMRELAIGLILANTPQAKGRVEKVNRTLQDRLVKELRLENIATIAEANQYLPEYVKKFNQKFAVKAKEEQDAHKQILPSEDLDKILVKKYSRILSKNLEFQYQNKTYQIKTDRPTYAMSNAPVTVTKDYHGKIRVYYKQKELEFQVMEETVKQIEANAKEINTAVEKLLQKRSHWKPDENHPWRNFTI